MWNLLKENQKKEEKQLEPVTLGERWVRVERRQFRAALEVPVLPRHATQAEGTAFPGWLKWAENGCEALGAEKVEEQKPKLGASPSTLRGPRPESVPGRMWPTQRPGWGGRGWPWWGDGGERPPHPLPLLPASSSGEAGRAVRASEGLSESGGLSL